mmetsp:Transcript_20997/g.31075  ORF Transcript_20997/g.31075 Transcript_20997/m.31075 type:complete len:285 (+) Transcript_20997:79-933(+)
MGKKKVKVRGDKYQRFQEEEDAPKILKKKKPKNKRSLSSSRDDYELRKMIQGPDGRRDIIEMDADGNCLFRSISHQLSHDFGRRHDTVRHEVCNYLEDNKDEFSIFLLLDEDEEDVRDFDSYVAEMREDGTWGGDVEIVCAARLYKRQVTIFAASGAYNIGIGDEKPSGPDMLLSFHENSHYNSVHDESSNSLHEVKVNEDNETEKDSSIAESAEGKSKLQRKNDLCPCGSNLRYKKCCLAIDKSRTRKEKFKMKNVPSEIKSEGVDNETETSEIEQSFNILTI